MSNEVSKKIVDDLLDLSVLVIRFAETSKVSRSILDQVTRSVTSIGANYTEAQDGSSKKDFINKIYVSKKEASETVYWLRLIEKLQNVDSGIAIDKCQRYVMMFQKIINSSREKKS